MRLNEAIQSAERERDLFDRVRRVRELVNFMRFARGWSYVVCARMAEKSGVSAARWEELLYEVDRYGGEV